MSARQEIKITDRTYQITDDQVFDNRQVVVEFPEETIWFGRCGQGDLEVDELSHFRVQKVGKQVIGLHQDLQVTQLLANNRDEQLYHRPRC